MLKIIYLNARSIFNKLNDLEVLLNEHSPDIVLITETWCSTETSMAMLNVNGYNIDPELRKDRTDTLNGIGGGLIVYFKEGLMIKSRNVTNDFNQFLQFEILCEDDISNLNITLVYRPPSSKEENTKELCKLIESAPENSIFIGDFNFPSIDWKYKTADKKCEEFLQCTKDCEYDQLVDFKTHIRGNLLDLVLAKNPEKIINIEPLGNLGNSDHTIILTEVLFKSKYCKTKEYISDWKNGDLEALSTYLNNVKWNEELNQRSADESWNYLKTTIHKGMDLFIPKVLRRQANKPKWMTKKVMRLIRTKQRRYNLFMQTRSPENENDFKKAQKECKKAVRGAKRKFEQLIATNGNKRPFNSYITSKTKNRTGVGPLKVNNETITDDKQMASVLNQSFCSVFTREDTNNVPFCPQLSNGTIRDIVFDQNEVREKILKLKPGTAQGPDKIPARILKDNVDILSFPLSIIFNKSMRSGDVPQDWKLANVTPIFKKGSKHKPENYRPVSLTSISCKLMESIIRDRVNSHLLRNLLINPSQHGFMKNKSCATNLLEFMERITNIIDEGDPADVVYLDFSKAFDKVPKVRLLAKIKAHGIEGRVLNWISEWLTDRKQRTVLNGSYSEWCMVLSGVPQGSVLGPLAFILYINDIDVTAELISILRKFADDTKLGHRVKTEEDRQVLQDCLDKLFEWSIEWCMDFNIQKCKVLHVGRTNKNFEYTMNGVILESVDKERDIGVITDKTLKPSLQCSEAARRATGVLTQISKAFLYRDRVTFLKLYTQFVRCHLEFSVTAWSPWTVSDKEVLEKVQIKAVNLITGLKGKTYLEKLNELGLLTLDQRRKRFDLIQTFKIIRGYDKVEAGTWFTLVGPEVARPTRLMGYKDNIVPKHSRMDLRQNFYSNRVANQWNSLPTNIKEAKSINIFKNLLDKHLFT